LFYWDLKVVFIKHIPKRNTKSFFIILQNGILDKMKINDYTKKRRLLSSKLIEAREQAGLSQKQVSDSKIVSQSELSKIENGARRIDFLILLELAKFYNQPISFFIPENESER
jgi:predicted XRE-type DNA-binding protein